MPTFLRTTQIAQDPEFESRVRAALVFQARSVIGTGRVTTPEFSHNYAVAIARNPAAYSATASWVVATDPDIQAAADTLIGITDDQITAAVKRTWPVLAGAI